MTNSTCKDSSVKILEDKYNRRITGEEAIAFRAANFYQLTFEEIDEPIPHDDVRGDESLDSMSPRGDELDRLVDRFPAPSDWHDE